MMFVRISFQPAVGKEESAVLRCINHGTHSLEDLVGSIPSIRRATCLLSRNLRKRLTVQNRKYGVDNDTFRPNLDNSSRHVQVLRWLRTFFCGRERGAIVGSIKYL